MATAQQLPGVLNISFVSGDEYSRLIDFSFDATGYSFSADVYSTVTEATLLSPTVAVVSAALGQVNVSFTEIQTASLTPGTYGVRVEWVAPGTSTRTALQGVVEVTR